MLSLGEKTALGNLYHDLKKLPKKIISSKSIAIYKLL